MHSLFGTARDRTWDLSIPSRTFYHCSTAPPKKEQLNQTCQNDTACLCQTGKELSNVENGQVRDMSAANKRESIKVMAECAVSMKKLYNHEECISQLFNASHIKGCHQ